MNDRGGVIAKHTMGSTGFVDNKFLNLDVEDVGGGTHVDTGVIIIDDADDVAGAWGNVGTDVVVSVDDIAGACGNVEGIAIHCPSIVRISVDFNAPTTRWFFVGGLFSLSSLVKDFFVEQLAFKE